MPRIKYFISPNSRTVTAETESQTDPAKKSPQDQLYYWFINNGDMSIVWINVFVFILGHVGFFWAYYVILLEFPWPVFTPTVKTWFWIYLVGIWNALAIGCGAHRLWAHRSFEAKWPLRLFLMIGQSIAGQNCIYIWCRDHRVHHKWSDTDADPHNTQRGYFFSHCGWLLCKKHPEMMAKSKTLDFSDLLADPLVRFQKDHYWLIYLVFVLYLPMAIPVWCWGENWLNSFLITYTFRYVVSLHCTWFVNSTAHMFGSKPYNSKIAPVENWAVSYGSFGEGYHNYHHTFPFDYRAAEDILSFNTTGKFINLMAKWGQAYNLKKTNKEMVERAKERIVRMQKINKGHSHIEVEYQEASSSIVRG